MTDGYDHEKDGAKMSYKNDMSYGDYLDIDSLVAAQRRLALSRRSERLIGFSAALVLAYRVQAGDES